MRLPERPYIHAHALERYREHHPTAGYDDVRVACQAAVEVDRELVAAVTRNPRRALERSNHFLLHRVTPELGGLFVWVTRTDEGHIREGIIKTYLRLCTAQLEILLDRDADVHPAACRCSSCLDDDGAPA